MNDTKDKKEQLKNNLSKLVYSWYQKLNFNSEKSFLLTNSIILLMRIWDTPHLFFDDKTYEINYEKLKSIGAMKTFNFLSKKVPALTDFYQNVKINSQQIGELDDCYIEQQLIPIIDEFYKTLFKQEIVPDVWINILDLQLYRYDFSLNTYKDFSVTMVTSIYIYLHSWNETLKEFRAEMEKLKWASI